MWLDGNAWPRPKANNNAQARRLNTTSSTTPKIMILKSIICLELILPLSQLCWFPDHKLDRGLQNYLIHSTKKLNPFYGPIIFGARNVKPCLLNWNFLCPRLWKWEGNIGWQCWQRGCLGLSARQYNGTRGKVQHTKMQQWAIILKCFNLLICCKFKIPIFFQNKSCTLNHTSIYL